MEVVVIGTDSKYATIVEKMRQRGMKIIMVPGNTVVIYKFDPHTGFQELTGEDAERYISLFLESTYCIEYY